MSEIKPTWKLAWGLLWRTWLIVLGIYGLIGIGYLIIFGLTLLLK